MRKNISINNIFRHVFTLEILKFYYNLEIFFEISKIIIAMSKTRVYNENTKGGLDVTIEEKLKELILNRYNSIREFTIAIDMPYSTLDSIFKRGIGNSSVTNIIKVCKALNISADALADGIIANAKNYSTEEVDNLEVNDIINNTKNMLVNGGKITLDGSPINQAGIESIIDAMDVGVEIAKKKKRP